VRPPTYPKKPHASGQARVKVSGKTIYLGVWGSPESYAKYQALVEQFRLAKLGQPILQPAIAPVHQPRVRDVLAAFLAAAESGERRTSKGELIHFRHCQRAVEASSLADRIAATFDADTLAALGHAMRGLDWGERHVARQLGRVRTVWRWAERKHLVPAGAWAHLRTLQIGGGLISEVPPVPEDDLAKTLPHLARIPRAIVETQLLTGARPGEILRLTPGMIHRSGVFAFGRVRLTLGKIWLADFGLSHKTGWRGHRKIILLGPQAQAVVRPFLDRAADAPLFSPREATAEYLASARRKDGKLVRQRISGKRRPGERYSIWTYEAAIERACKRAGVPKWNPGQLRHNAATRLCAEFGPEIARVVLGHRELQTTRNYVQDDLLRAAEAVEKAG
jgi:integrase